MNGFLIVDKPIGMSSYDLVRIAGKTFRRKKIGHIGTLDPLASGLMILAVGEATKFIEFLVGLPKKYLVEAKFGFRSATYDSEGPFTPGGQPVNADIDQKIYSLIRSSFLGKIKQIPPKYSAKKIDGQKAYLLARAGVDFRPHEVEVEIFEFDFSSPCSEVDKRNFSIKCSSGTYVRSLINDLGEVLGVGAYVSKLRRVEIGGFLLDNKYFFSLPINANGQFFIPADRLVSLEDFLPFFGFWRVNFSVEEAKKLLRGEFVSNNKFDQGVGVALCNQKIIGIIEPVSGRGAVKLKKFVWSDYLNATHDQKKASHFPELVDNNFEKL